MNRKKSNIDTHEREKMTIKKFKHDIIRGLGTCFIELNKTDDIEKYKSIVLYGCLNVLSFEVEFEGSRSHYMYDLTQYYNDDDFFVNAIINKINRKLRNKTLIITLIERLAVFATNGSLKAKQTLFERYNQIIRKHRSNEQEYIVLDFLCVNLVDVAGFRFLKYHIRTMQKLAHIIDKDELGWFYWKVQDIYKSKAKELLNQIYPDYDNTIDQPKEEKDYSFNGIVSHLNSDDFYMTYFMFMYRATKFEITQTIDFLIEEANVNQKLKLLKILNKNSLTYRIEDIIDLLGKYSTEIDYEIYEYCSHVTKSKAIKSLGYDLLEQPNYRAFGIQMIMRNYQHKDNDVVIKYVKKVKVDYSDSKSWFSMFSTVIDILDSTNKRHPKELLDYVFIETLSSFHREWVYDVLKKRHLLTKSFLEIAQYDSDLDISTQARKELTKRQQSNS